MNSFFLRFISLSINKCCCKENISVSIFIFEDDIIQAQHVRRLVEEICENNDIKYDFIEVTSRAENIIEKIPLTTHIPIYFLDIEIKSEERRGLEVAQMIRTYDQD